MKVKKINYRLIVSMIIIIILSYTIPLTRVYPQIWTTTPIKTNLDNGTTILFEKDESSRITVLKFFIRGGKKADPEDKGGLFYITTRIALEIPDRQKAQDFMLQATNLSMDCENDYSVVTVTCLSEKLEDSLDIISDIMLKPLFSTLRINRIKENMLNRKKIEQDDSRNKAYQTMMKLLFKDTGYKGSVYGDELSLKKIKKKDIVDFYDTYFTTDNMIIAVSTDLDKETTLKYLNQYFAELKSGSSFKSKDLTLSSIETQSLHVPKQTKQTFISVGYRLPQINLKNYALALILENLLGNGIGSKLWVLREKKKLAYNINAKINYFKNGGMLEALLETENPKKEEALKAAHNTLEGLYSKGIDLEELNRTKVYTKASFLRSNETKRERTDTMAFFEIMNLGLDSFDNIFMKIDSIDLQEMNAYLKKTLDPKNRVEVTVGPE